MVIPHWTVIRQGDGRLRVEREKGVGTLLDKESRSVYLADAIIGGGSMWIWLDGELFEMPIASRANRGDGAARSGDEAALTPKMSAKVIRVLVTPGQSVAAGDVLVVLEAMKMEMPIKAPHAGTVTAVNCAEGELVTPAGPVLVLSPK